MSIAPEEKALETVAELMCLAARTAPKAKGFDNLTITIVRGDQKAAVTARMREIAEADDLAFFARDAGNCDAAPLVVLIGTVVRPIKVPHCGFCGHGDCAGCAEAGGLCFFNGSDLGTALGSAAAVAASHHADCRMMFSFGKAAVELGILPEDVTVAIAIPIAGTGKSPFFDRE
ncbi:ferredoxin [bacterium]|nr:ferredoxin [bacterium]